MTSEQIPRVRSSIQYLKIPRYPLIFGMAMAYDSDSMVLVKSDQIRPDAYTHVARPFLFTGGRATSQDSAFHFKTN
jgi:hypothetical protein